MTTDSAQMTKGNHNTGEAPAVWWMSWGVNAAAFAPAGYFTAEKSATTKTFSTKQLENKGILAISCTTWLLQLRLH